MKIVSKQMDFPRAMRSVMGGKSVTKLEWGKPEIHVCMFDNKLVIYKEDGQYHPLIVTSGDLFGKDWVIVE